MNPNLRDLNWQANFNPIIGKRVKVKTKEGSHREGRLSDVKFTEVNYKSKVQETKLGSPIEIELNGEKDDLIAWDRIESLEVIE